MSKLARFFLGASIGVAVATCAFIAVYFRPFWRSEWGGLTFGLICWAVLSLYLGFAGKGKPYSLRFGLIAGTAISFYAYVTLLITKYTGVNIYIGMIPFFLLVYMSAKSKFVQDRVRELNPGDCD